MLHDVTGQELRAILVWMLCIPSSIQFGEPRKKQVERLAFFYPIRRIGMESPAGCMESVIKRRHGILLARSQLALRHVVLCSVKDGTLAEQSALVRLQASLQTHFACLSRVSVYPPSD